MLSHLMYLMSLPDSYITNPNKRLGIEGHLLNLKPLKDTLFLFLGEMIHVQESMVKVKRYGFWCCYFFSFLIFSPHTWREIYKHQKYITNLLFHRVPPSNLLEGIQLMEVADQKRSQRAFPIDSSQYFHYNNTKHHYQGL